MWKKKQQKNSAHPVLSCAFHFRAPVPDLLGVFCCFFGFNWVLPYIFQVLIASAILFYPGLILIDHGHFQYPLTFCQRKVLIYSLLYPSSKYKGGSRTQKKYSDKQILSYFLCKFWIDNCEFFKCSEFEIYFYHHSILLQGLTSLPPSLWLRYTLSCKCEDCLFI